MTRSMVAEAERKQAAFTQAADAADRAALAAAAAAENAAAGANTGSRHGGADPGAGAAAGPGGGAGARSGAPAPPDPKQQEELTDFLNKFRIIVVRTPLQTLVQRLLPRARQHGHIEPVCTSIYPAGCLGLPLTPSPWRLS